MPELSRPCRQLHPGQSGGDADAHRAGMVLPAVLRDPARDPEQADRRRSRCSARSSSSPSCRGSTPRGCGRRPTGRSTGSSSGSSSRSASGSAGSARKPAGRRLRDRRAHPHRLLLRPLPHHPAAARLGREDQAAAELDLGSDVGFGPRRAAEGGENIMSRTILALALALALAGSLLGLSHRRRICRGRRAGAAAPEVVVRRPVRQVRQGQLQRGFKVYREVCQSCHGLNLLVVPQPATGDRLLRRRR